MKTLFALLKNSRQNLGLKTKEVAANKGIDQALISKFENGSRLPTEEQLIALASVYRLGIKELRVFWLAEKVLSVIQYETTAAEVLMVAESRVEYLRSSKALEVPPLAPSLLGKLETIDGLRDEWQRKKPLNNTQLEKMRSFFNIEYTYESNRIEGNTLSLQETSLVVNEGLTISGKSMREHLEAVNHAEAVDFIIELAGNKEDLNKRTLMDLHALILKTIDRENAGRFRSVPVRISGSQHEPPQPFLLEKLMEEYFIHYRRQMGSMHPVILAAEMHERLVSIHPFIDGNGRTSRLVMNLILLRNGYTIANLKGDVNSRLAYYRALEKVQVDNEPEVFYGLVADAVEQSLKAHLALV
jgi:fido (protein-threonine AMPylation protein)